MLVVCALKNSQLTGGESHVIHGTGHQAIGAEWTLRSDLLAVIWNIDEIRC
jgi:hypothetical protein